MELLQPQWLLLMLLHIRGDGFLPSSKVTGTEDAACPFYRSCTLQLRVDHGQVCKAAPWQIYALSKDTTCWYGAAVAGVLGTVKQTPEAPGADPGE